MEALVQLFIFIFAGAVIWFFSGVLITAVDKLARRFHKSGFVVAFFVLGFLTSISEISVAVNSSIGKVPQVSVGNLVGASFVILLLIVPVLAIIGNGIKLKDTITGRNLFIALAVILLPSFLVMDGDVTYQEGILALLAYGALLFAIRNQPTKSGEEPVIDKTLLGKKPLVFAFGQIAVGAISIFIAGNILVEQSVYFADFLHIPKSLVGLVLLSLGTNIPEIVIAVRAVLERQQGIAFGDYLGSTVTNTATFALLAIANGPFGLESSEFVVSSVLLTVGLVAFYFFAQSKDTISRQEGYALFIIYLMFFIVQIFNVVRFAS